MTDVLGIPILTKLQMKDYLIFMKNVINLNLNHSLLQIIIAVTSKWMLIQTIIFIMMSLLVVNIKRKHRALVTNSKSIE